MVAMPDIPPGAEAPLEERVRALVERLSAYIEYYHGGRVEFVALEGDTLRVRLGGACAQCGLTEVTLHGWIEGTVRQFFPEVQQVVAVK